MTDTPDLPPEPPPPAVAPVPSAAPVPPATLPPGTPAGRPRIGQAALLFLAFGIVAGGSCAAFLGGMSARGTSSDVWSFLFVASVPFAAATFALLVFRLWRRRFAENWPSVGQSLLMGVAGVALAVGGCGGWAMTMEATALLPVAFGLGAAFVVGTALAVGAGELFVVAVFRLIFGRPGAR
jgi:hypothetical protein